MELWKEIRVTTLVFHPCSAIYMLLISPLKPSKVRLNLFLCLFSSGPHAHEISCIAKIVNDAFSTQSKQVQYAAIHTAILHCPNLPCFYRCGASVTVAPYIEQLRRGANPDEAWQEAKKAILKDGMKYGFWDGDVLVEDSTKVKEPKCSVNEIKYALSSASELWKAISNWVRAPTKGQGSSKCTAVI